MERRSSRLCRFFEWIGEGSRVDHGCTWVDVFLSRGEVRLVHAPRVKKAVSQLATTVQFGRTPRVKTRGYTGRSPPDGGLRRLIQIRCGHSRSVHFHGVNGEISSDRRCTVRTKCGLRYCAAWGFNPTRRCATPPTPHFHFLWSHPAKHARYVTSVHVRPSEPKGS